MSESRTKHRLTEKQIRFCQEYIIDLNGTQAAIRAGYSETSAAESASESLNKSNIQNYIQELIDDRAARTMATADKVLSELYHLISFDASEIFDAEGRLKDIHSLSPETRKAIASIEIEEEFDRTGENKVQTGFTKKIRFWDKTKALEMLAKHHKLLVDRSELSGPGGGPIQFSISVQFTKEEENEIDCLFRKALERRNLQKSRTLESELSNN